MSSSPVQTLEQERARASFDTAEMINILAGSAETAQIRELVMAEIENNELLSASSYDLSLPEIRSLVMEKIKYMMVTYARRSGFSYDSHGGAGSSANSDTGGNAAEVTERMTMTKKLGQTFWDQLSQLDSSWAIRIGVHFGLFQNAVNGQGTEEQRAKYGPLMQKMRIFGCFAMTELGHGSYVRGLETTSTYYSATEEFVINTPTVTATKWWIGGAGQTATHAVVYARLIIEGKDYGVQGFIVQLRDLETGEPLPGIEVGDCGAKMGRNGVDNGWIRFHKVRVPRENMLMRWAQVSADGVFTQPPKAQMSYGALIPGRVMIMRSAAEAIKKALTIAIRYSAVRRQFPSADDPNVEEKILDYQTHKHNLMPMLATTYAMHMTAVVLTDNLDALKQDLENDDLTSLQEVHATSAGLKAFSTWWANSAIEVCRQALGGHGYSSYSGLPSLLADFAINCTWEGTNVVMAQQTSRFLMSACSNVRAGRLGDLSGFEGYLVGGETTLMTSCTAGSKEDLASEETLFDAHRWVAIKLVFAAHDRLEAAKMGGMNETAAWNECMVDLVACARAHCYFAVLKCFSDGIARLDANANASEVAVLRTLFRLFGVSNLEDYLSHTRGSYFSEEQAEWLSELKRDLCDEVRVNAVALVDSFALSDVLVNSPLGCYDGDIYSRYFEAVKAAPHAQGIPPYFEDHIKPLTSRL